MGNFSVQVTQTPGIIDFDFDAVKVAVEEKTSVYNGIVVAETDIPNAKKDLADLRKFRKELDDSRKAVKNEWMKPYEAFEERAKQLLKLIDEPIALIDGQLKDFEKARIEAKQKHLHDLYEQNIGGLAEYLPFESLKKPSWDNKSISDQDIVYSIQEAAVKVSTDLDAIHALHSECEENLINAYKRSGNVLSAAIAENTRYLEAKAQVKERIRQEQEHKAREEAERKAAEAEAERKASEIAKTDVLDADFEKKSQNSDLKTPKDDFINPPEPAFWIGVFDEKAMEDIRAYCEFNEIPYKKEVR